MEDLGGKTIISRTYEAAVKTGLFDDVFVVTDSDIIYNEIAENGGKAMMSIKEHESGSDRIAEAVQNRSKDELIGPIRSGAGFHILKVIDTRGIEKVEVVELNSRHILIKPSVILSDEKAQQMLKDFREKILSGEADFAALAKEYSADPGSALKGGELGWADPNAYVPEFRDTLNKLAIDEISEPVRTVHGWHLMQLLGKRVDDATEKLKEEKASQLLFQRKFSEETDAWLREIRAGAYIDVIAKKES